MSDGLNIMQLHDCTMVHEHVGAAVAQKEKQSSANWKDGSLIPG